MSEREKIANGYTNGEGGLEPLTWGRMKIAQRALAGASEEDMPDVAAALYLMPFSKLRTLPKDKFVARCVAFAKDIPAAEVMRCGLALTRDMAAIEASEMEIVQGKTEGAVEGPAPSPTPASCTPD